MQIFTESSHLFLHFRQRGCHRTPCTLSKLKPPLEQSEQAGSRVKAGAGAQLPEFSLHPKGARAGLRQVSQLYHCCWHLGLDIRCAGAVQPVAPLLWPPESISSLWQLSPAICVCVGGRIVASRKWLLYKERTGLVTKKISSIYMILDNIGYNIVSSE